mgnify:CR=1 FL=1
MFTTTILLAGVMCNFLLSMQNKIIMKEQVVMKIQIYDNGYDVKNQVIYLLKKYEEEKGVSFEIDIITDADYVLTSTQQTDIAFYYICDTSKIEKIRQYCLNNPNTKVIIIANIPDYRYTFKFHAFDFMTLPVNEQNFFHAIDDALFYLTNSAKEQKITLQTTTVTLNVKPSQIYYFEHNSRKIIISTVQGEYFGNYTLKRLREKFYPYDFDLPHKSYLVNLAHIRYIKGFDIYLNSGIVIPLAQKRAVYFKAVFQHYINKRFEVI